ncbi:hypothetical protein GUITHDRAFT_105377 [Guillardia theta CCMP2712]|uniref:Uncharacterized protein n=2 Tax=Guillardia theta TaxID=55529 RepID=L1JJN8_GUITC|nr:hypothetical protein GUITHDRAFT_105377 [Guillardia theta CCMP2712]EKX48748.1 hypothetical protein GUITHDRAFT_105377 [Guillardia theta CCMP2712]|eukprot:XP_005835728.1 hypothetical protein GUITHDRAFT_105377 [Guillardia theta CCMP2712]
MVSTTTVQFSFADSAVIQTSTSNYNKNLAAFTWQQVCARRMPSVRSRGTVTCGLRDNIARGISRRLDSFKSVTKRLNPFGSSDKEAVRQQWQEGLQSRRTSEPLVSKPVEQSEGRQSVPTIKTNPERSTKTLSVAAEKNFDVLSIEDDETERKAREEAAAADMARILGKKLMAQRENDLKAAEAARIEAKQRMERVRFLQREASKTLGKDQAEAVFSGIKRNNNGTTNISTIQTPSSTVKLSKLNVFRAVKESNTNTDNEEENFSSSPSYSSPSSPSVLRSTPLSSSAQGWSEQSEEATQAKPRGSWGPSRYITRRYENLDPKAVKVQGRHLGPRADEEEETAEGGETSKSDTESIEDKEKTIDMSAAPALEATAQDLVPSDIVKTEEKDMTATSARTLANSMNRLQSQSKPQQSRWKVVATKGVDLHADAEGTADIVGHLKSYALVTVEQEKEGWLYIRSPMIGWAKMRNERGLPQFIRLGKTLKG